MCGSILSPPPNSNHLPKPVYISGLCTPYNDIFFSHRPPPKPTQPSNPKPIAEDDASMKIFGKDALAELNEALMQLNNIQGGSSAGALSFF